MFTIKFQQVLSGGKIINIKATADSVDHFVVKDLTIQFLGLDDVPISCPTMSKMDFTEIVYEAENHLYELRYSDDIDVADYMERLGYDNTNIYD